MHQNFQGHIVQRCNRPACHPNFSIENIFFVGDLGCATFVPSEEVRCPGVVCDLTSSNDMEIEDPIARNNHRQPRFVVQQGHIDRALEENSACVGDGVLDTQSTPYFVVRGLNIGTIPFFRALQIAQVDFGSRRS